MRPRYIWLIEREYYDQAVLCYWCEEVCITWQRIPGGFISHFRMGLTLGM